jgi:hypothetical protein
MRFLTDMNTTFLAVYTLSLLSCKPCVLLLLVPLASQPGSWPVLLAATLALVSVRTVLQATNRCGRFCPVLLAASVWLLVVAAECCQQDISALEQVS